MAAYTDLVPFVTPEIARCPTATVLFEAKNAVIEFCERTGLWVSTLATIKTVANQQLYTPTLASGTRLVKVREVSVNGVELTAKTPDELDRILPIVNDMPWRESSAPDTLYFYQPTRTQVRIVPAPESVYDMIVTASIKPSLAGASFDDRIMDDWHEALAHGIKARLMAYRDAEWSNPGDSRFHREEFDAAVRDATGEIVTGNNRNDQTTGRVRMCP